MTRTLQISRTFLDKYIFNQSIFSQHFQLGFDTFKIPRWFLSTAKPVHDQMKIHYQTHSDDILPGMLTGFFEGYLRTEISYFLLHPCHFGETNSCTGYVIISDRVVWSSFQSIHISSI